MQLRKNITIHNYVLWFSRAELYLKISRYLSEIILHLRELFKSKFLKLCGHPWDENDVVGCLNSLKKHNLDTTFDEALGKLQTKGETKGETKITKPLKKWDISSLVFFLERVSFLLKEDEDVRAPFFETRSIRNDFAHHGMFLHETVVYRIGGFSKLIL